VGTHLPVFPAARSSRKPPRSPHRDFLLFAIGLLVAVAALGQLQGLCDTLLQAYVGERLVLDFRARLVGPGPAPLRVITIGVGTADSLYRNPHERTGDARIWSMGFHSSVSLRSPGHDDHRQVLLDWQLALVALA